MSMSLSPPHGRILSGPDGAEPLSFTICHFTASAERGRRSDVAEVLSQFGYEVTQVTDGPLDLSSTGVIWLHGNANWFPGICRQLAASPKASRPPVILWHFEPLPPSRQSGIRWPVLYLREIAKIILRDRRATDIYTNFWRLRRLHRLGLPDVLVVTTRSRQEFLEERGLPVHRVPLGYHPKFGRDLGLKRDLPVLFLGALTVPRRRRLVRSLRRRGVDLLALGSWHDPSYFGEQRTQLLNRTKIFLNLARNPGKFAAHRLILGMANKTLVISESVYKPDPFIPGKHFVMAPLAEIPEVINYYLSHDQEREAIVQEGHRFVTQELTLERAVSDILNLLKSHLDRRQE